MTDTMTTSQRHLCMSHIHSLDTKPELKVRKWLWSHGYRYRLNVKGVPGKPDIVMRRYRTAIFVNGCFWHGHNVELETECPKSGVANSACCKIPKSNTEFWINKIRRNQERDHRNYRVLKENGWQVLVLWECKLTKKLLETTMQQVEVALHEYCLKTISTKVKEYIRIDEDSVQMAAEAESEYGDDVTRKLDDIHCENKIASYPEQPCHTLKEHKKTRM